MRPSIALAAAAVLLTACGGSDGTDGVRLPDLELPALDAGSAALDVGSLRGPAVVNVWATWCVPCRQELPAFEEVARSRPDVRFVGVNSVETGDAREFLDGLGITYEQFVDDRGRLAEEIGAVGLPATVVVDADGDVATAHVGPMSVEDLEAALAEVS